MKLFRVLALASLWLLASAGWAQQPSGVGVVLLHGMGGGAMSMSTLSYELRERGHLVAAPELPWSAMRGHDVTVEAAVQEVAREIEGLRRKGARRVVLAGFSKGGLFAAHVATRHPVDALVAISPNALVRAGEIDTAQLLLAQGRATEKTELQLFDPIAQRRYPIFTTAQAFLSWFGPDSPMTLEAGMAGLPRGLPVMLVVAKRDVDNLLQLKQAIYDGLPAHRAKRLYEPDANHIGAVNASAAEVARWIDATLPRR